MKKTNNIDKAQFAKKLKYLRVNGNFTKSELAKGTDLTTASLIRLENGEKVPRMATLKKLAEFFNVPVTYFIYGDFVEPTKAQSVENSNLIGIPLASINKENTGDSLQYSDDIVFYFPAFVIEQLVEKEKINSLFLMMKSPETFSEEFGESDMLLFCKTTELVTNKTNLVKFKDGSIGFINSDNADVYELLSDIEPIGIIIKKIV